MRGTMRSCGARSSRPRCVAGWACRRTPSGSGAPTRRRGPGGRSGSWQRRDSCRCRQAAPGAAADRRSPAVVYIESESGCSGQRLLRPHHRQGGPRGSRPSTASRPPGGSRRAPEGAAAALHRPPHACRRPGSHHGPVEPPTASPTHQVATRKSGARAGTRGPAVVFVREAGDRPRHGLLRPE